MAKLRGLRRSHAAWTNLHWSHRAPQIPIHNYAAVYELSGGYFFEDMNSDFHGSSRTVPSTLSWLRLPSHHDPSPGEWRTANFDFKVADLCLDVERDLIAVVERTDIAYVLLIVLWLPLLTRL